MSTTYRVAASSDAIDLAATGTAAILQNVSIILGTAKNEAPLWRDFGLDTSELTDAPVSRARGLLIAGVREAVEEYEPRVKVTGVYIGDVEDGKISPVVEVELSDE